MNEGQSWQTDKQPGFCSATCMDENCVRREIAKPELKTSDLYAVCDLPKRFEHPHWFNGYGCQVSKQHPFYRTSASEYGWYPSGVHSVPAVFFPKDHKFSNDLAVFGYCAVPAQYYPAGQSFTGRLSAAGMYRNYGLNTAMDKKFY